MNNEDKEEQKRLKLQAKLDREEKAKAKKAEAQKKRLLQEARKAAKPGECMKHMTVFIDPGLVSRPVGTKIIALLCEKEQKYEIQNMPYQNVITFWREVSEIVDNSDNQCELIKRDVPDDDLLMWLSAEQFVSYIRNGAGENNEPFCKFLKNLIRKFEDRKITLIVQGLQQYMKMPKGRQKDAGLNVSRLELEETLLDVQMSVGCNVAITDSDQETAETVFQYLKAVAEAPFKRDKSQNVMNLHVDNSTTVRIDKDGNGVVQAWRNIIQLFKNVSADQANAIMAVYPTPSSLMLAYQKCSEVEGLKLLEDINVRRGYGVMESNRRIGKELSKKMYTLFTSLDPEVVLK